MFQVIKKLPSGLMILVGIFFAYGNITGMDYWVKGKDIGPFLVIAFGIGKFGSEKENKRK